MNQRSRIALLGARLLFPLAVGTAATLGALGACSVRGGIDFTPPRLVVDTAPASSKGRDVGPASKDDRAPSRDDRSSSGSSRSSSRTDRSPARDDRQASAGTDLRTSSSAAQRAVDFWKEDLAKDDDWSHIKQAQKKMRSGCGCAPDLQPVWEDFAQEGNDVLAACPVTAVDGAADTLVSACRVAGRDKVCAKVKTISIQRGTPKGKCLNCDPINQVTLQHGALSYFCMEIEGMSITGGQGKLAPLFE